MTTGQSVTASEAVDQPPRIAEGSPRWRVTLATMVGVQVVMSASFTFLSPVLPLFLPHLGVAPASAVNFWAGVLAATTSAVAVFTSPFWGRMSDRYGRKLMVLRSSLAISICLGLMGLAQNVWHLLALRVLMGVFAGFGAASVILVASQVPERRLGYALGLLSTGQLVGSLVGPVLGGVLRDVSGSDRIPFFVAGVIGLVAFALCWWLVPERFTPPKEHRKRTTMAQSMRAMSRNPGLSALVLVLLLTQFGVMAIQPIITLFVQDLVGQLPNLGTLSGLAFSATGLAGVAAVPLLGRWSDGIGYRRVLLICLAGAALLTAPQAFVGGYGAFVTLRFGVGLFVGGIVPAANALIGRLTPPEDRGFTYGMTSSAYFLGNALGPLTGGVVSAMFGLHWVFLVTAVLLFLNLAWVWVTVPHRIGMENA